MVKIFFSRLREYPEEDKFLQLLSTIPKKFHPKILAYKQREDRMLRLMGKLLLIESFNQLGIESDTLMNHYLENVDGKPSVNLPFYFNLSYSKGIAVCVVSDEGKVGIDIEYITPISDINLYKDYFSDKEWQGIMGDKMSPLLFYEYWTRKEALLKAAGKGLKDDLSTIEVINDEVIVYNIKYNINSVNIAADYICNVANSGEKSAFELMEINLC